MSYTDAIYDRDKDKILVAERINGQRRLSEHLPEHVFYYEHGAGTHRTIFDHVCKKFRTPNIRKFRAELGKKRDEGVRIFESDINPVFRFLADNFMGADSPVLNLCFFDIEVDFDAERGFAPTDDPFNKVTAITFYLTATGKLHTLALCPPTLTLDQAREMTRDFENTQIFDDEAKLLDCFLDMIEDADVLSGWNCLPKTAHVWLDDRIQSLAKIQAGNTTIRHGRVVRWHDSGMKRVNQIILDNGLLIEASEEHRIPVMTKPIAHYRRPSSLMRSEKDYTVADIKEMLAKGDSDCYVEINIRNNDQPDYTYRSFFMEFLSDLFSNPDFDIAVEHDDLKNKVRKTLTESGDFDKHFPYSRKFSSHADHPRAWASRAFSFLSIDDVREQIRSSESVRVIFTNNDPVRIMLDEPISTDACHMLGLMFTDKTFYRKETSFTLYGSDLELMTHAREVIMREVPCHGEKKLNRCSDGCIPLDFRRGSVLGVLATAIYDECYKKRINVPILSRLSHEQFTAFFAGLVDGDGCVRKDNIQVANYDRTTNAIQELLLWNGVYASRSDVVVVVAASDYNKSFIQSLDLWHTKRAKLEGLKFSPVSNSPSKSRRRFLLPGKAIVRVREITETDDYVPMGDIETEAHYFDCSGIRVHNSEGYDVPYLVNRIRRDKSLGNDALKKLCLWGQTPREREYTKFGKTFKTYEFVGRVHLDYLLLYQKHNTQQQHSYRLDYIGEIEVGENKTPYEGTLDDLYKKDFRRFIEYNRQDVMILVKIDQKRKFIELANQIAHANCVLLKTTMGSVALVEQAIINEMHKMGFIVPDRKPKEDDKGGGGGDDDEDEDRTPVVGAYVATPKFGLNYEIGCVDINSLYPSTIRALNMSPETIIGQVRQDETMALIEQRIRDGVKRADAWEGIFMTLEVQHMHDRSDDMLTVEFEDGRVVEMTGAQLYDYVFDPANHVCITANGTLFRTDKDGMIPLLLGTWYAERKQLQAKAKEFSKKAKEATEPDVKKDAEYWATFWDQRQLSRKILLNSLYGALLNEGLRFFDERLGQSTTLTGRSIVRHMNAQINKVVTGEYDYRGRAITYADTDSVANDSRVSTNVGRMSIEDFFNTCGIKWCVGEKEYATDDRLTVVGYKREEDHTVFTSVNYVYRHRVSKRRFRVTDNLGRCVVVTEDHSIMVERDGMLTEVKATEITEKDVLITTHNK